MIKTKKINRVINETIEETVIDKIFCDFCNKECFEIFENIDIFEGITNFKIEPGYGSKFDMERFSIDICDDCLEEKIKKLNIKTKH